MKDLLVYLKNNTLFKVLMSIILGGLSSIILVCIYGILIGGEYLSFNYLLYVLVISFFSSASISIIFFGKDFFVNVIGKRVFLCVLIAFAALNFILYPSLNKLTASKEFLEYETEITECFTYPKSDKCELFFMDSENNKAKINYYEPPVYLDDELIPKTNGRMVVRERMGGFNLKIYELIEITYEPYYVE